MSIMPTFTRWVRDSIYLQFETGNLFRDDEALVHACRQASSSANVAENAGDAFVTQGFGRTIVYNILLKLPGMERLAGDLHDAFVEDLAGYFVANVGFGPYAAEVLGLRRLYKFTPGLEMNREVEAGLFEQTIHLLQRAGMDALTHHILLWCVGCVLFMVKQGRKSNFLAQLHPEAFQYADDLGARDLEYPFRAPNFDIVFRVDDPASEWLPSCLDHPADKLFNAWVNLCMREAGGAAMTQSIMPVEIAQQRKGGHIHAINQGSRTMYYMDLLCYEHDCSVKDSTGAHEWEDGAREEAEKEMHLWKPSTKGWTRARCPKHGAEALTQPW